MMNVPTTRIWASCVACLAAAIATSAAFAQEQQSQQDQDRQSNQEQWEEEGQSRQSDSQQGQQSRQGDQQSRQGDQQANQRDQQANQRDQQSDQRDRGRQEDWSDMPRPDQDGREGQSQRDQQAGRDRQQQGQAGDQDAGLGVSIARDGGEGIRVLRVHRGSPADEMGLRQGDRITRINGERVQSTEQFISQVRNMNPGEQIELDVRRDNRQRSFRGELESRQEALVLRGQRGRDRQQSDYQQRRGRDSYGRSGGSGEISRQIERIERQVDQLSQQIDDLRYALRNVRQQAGRETTAGYEEYRRSDEPRMTERWDEDRRQFNSRDRQFDGGQFDGQGSRQYERRESPGGETGEERLRPDRN